MAEEALYQVSKKIVSEIGPRLTNRPYIAIIDKFGKIQYMDEMVEKYKEFMSGFVRNNFSFLRIFDHSIPISGLNMVFFKISKNIILVIYMKEGLVGQLLAFKKDMERYASEIDENIVLEPPEEGAPEPSTQEVEIEKPEEFTEEERAEEEVIITPTLVKKMKKLKKKKKFPLNEIMVLNLCDGDHSVKEIAEEANIDVLAVWDVLEKYKKKKLVKITYSGNPDFVPVLTKKIPPMAVQLRLMSSLEYKIAKLCDGTRTIEEIEEKLDIDGDKLSELIDRMEKNQMIRMDIKRK
ncbi:MAG: hypothetical protein GF329_11675 [Candidatus Lokiarchaeota archaeon]|nr:hypothetical protein [Candidatus Lokiarchaeota archaeon]